MHNRENVKVLLGYMQLFNCMGLPGKSCYNHEWYFDPRGRDITLFNTVLVYIEGFSGILWEVTRKQRFLGDNLRRNSKKKKKIVTWQFHYSAVKQFPPIFQFSGQWAMQLSDFSSYPSTYAWKQCMLCCSGTGPKSDSDQFPLQKHQAGKQRPQKWTRSYNHWKILCYLEVTSTRFRKPSCLRSSTALQNHCSIMYHVKQCSDYTTFQHKCYREADFICKCRAGVLSELQLWKLLNECYITLGCFFQQNFKINSFTKT